MEVHIKVYDYQLCKYFVILSVFMYSLCYMPLNLIYFIILKMIKIFLNYII